MITRPASAQQLQGKVMEAAWMPAAQGTEVPDQVVASSVGTSAQGRFRAIVDAHFSFIWRSLRGLGIPRDQVDDAAQHVFFIASQKLDAITLGSERSFLFGTALGVAANARRAIARAREVVDEETLGMQTDQRPSPEQAAASSQARRILDRILGGLPEEQRAVFVLFELEGLTTAEIAELLHVPRGTVASRLRRAREEFQAASGRIRALATKGDERP